MIADAERASSVVNRVRALGRKDPSEHRPVDLNAVINDVVRLVAREIASHQSMIPKSGYRFSEKIMLQQSASLRPTHVPEKACPRA